MWSGGTLHGASAHAPRQPGEAEGHDPASVRRGVVMIFNLGYVRPEQNFHYAMPQEVHDVGTFENDPVPQTPEKSSKPVDILLPPPKLLEICRLLDLLHFFDFPLPFSVPDGFFNHPEPYCSFLFLV